jgi:hypothetical protein
MEDTMLKPDRRRAAVTSADITRQEDALEALKSRLQRQEYQRVHAAAEEAGVDLSALPHQALVDVLITAAQQSEADSLGI